MDNLRSLKAAASTSTMDTFSLEEACAHLEGNPGISIQRMVINAEQLVSINVQSNRFKVFDKVFDVDTWGRFGRAVQNSSLKELRIQGRIDDDDDALILRRFVTTTFLGILGGRNGDLTAMNNGEQGRHNSDVTVMNSELLAAVKQCIDAFLAQFLPNLVGNTRLKSLCIHWHAVDSFDSEKLLCDTSSIESISNSNHTLEDISVHGDKLSSTSMVTKCLVINENEDKAKVIRDKILLFYFGGDFDTSPFSNMALSVLPEVMSQIRGKNEQSALYRLLRCTPELSNVSSRASS